MWLKVNLWTWKAIKFLNEFEAQFTAQSLGKNLSPLCLILKFRKLLKICIKQTLKLAVKIYCCSRWTVTFASVNTASMQLALEESLLSVPLTPSGTPGDSGQS